MSPRVNDTVLTAGLWLGAGASGSVVLLIGGFLVWEAWPAFGEIGFAGFVRDASWHPSEGRFNVVPMVMASLLAMGGALLLAGPLGLLVAVFCGWYAPRPVAVVTRRVLELLAGVPSVVYGFWGLVTLVPLLGRWRPPGASLLAGTLILAVMVLPTVALLSEAALRQVPGAQVRGAAALGLRRWAVLWRVVIPGARGGIATASLLAAGRAIGETMAVLMVCGNVVQLPGFDSGGPFAPVRTLTANIALEMGYAFGAHRSALFVTGLMLLAVVVGLVGVASRFGSPRPRKWVRQGVAVG
ncbi:MAG: phosphate ABC transporter permease subunit PstC [Planctomycetota bacterium]